MRDCVHVVALCVSVCVRGIAVDILISCFLQILCKFAHPFTKRIETMRDQYGSSNSGIKIESIWIRSCEDSRSGIVLQNIQILIHSGSQAV